MTQIGVIVARELKLGFRNPWAYSFLVVFSLFMLSLTLINAQGYVQGYSGASSTMMNLTLYLLPLMTLMLGSFSLTAEKEEGSWSLLSTYPLTTTAFITGKYIGIAIVLLTIVSIGYGIAGIAGSMAGAAWSLDVYLLLFSFSLILTLLYLAVAFLFGALVSNRWQALTLSISIWFFSVVGWPALLISVLSFLPYGWVQPVISVVTIFNPAEFARLFAVIKLGGGSALGPEYYQWVQWVQGTKGTIAALVFFLTWMMITLECSKILWGRRGRHG
ncbi:ABC transporter permease [Aureibacillus halotolerans]|uniref:Cu-processing system permease protein n=1 Tax=Aureibacillus halotolerans TaxID=1508390 RepID=A0A4R6TRG5_9BACI|nr:ABC transporter permease [Aureibacillus halotolerans]TDQ34615.1 Cu-processing system permease protein [Aureibacillus halotolerans]